MITSLYATFITLVSLGLLAMKVVALVDVARRRPDAFPAVDRQTKQLWLILTIGGVVGHLVSFHPGQLLNLAGSVIAIVYLVDVRPRIASLFGR